MGAIEYFARSDENERDLVRQVGILDAGKDPARANDEAPQQPEGPSLPVNQETGRREVELLPGLQQPIHHVQRRGTVPRLHRPPPEGE